MAALSHTSQPNSVTTVVTTELVGNKAAQGAALMANNSINVLNVTMTGNIAACISVGGLVQYGGQGGAVFATYSARADVHIWGAVLMNVQGRFAIEIMGEKASQMGPETGGGGSSALVGADAAFVACVGFGGDDDASLLLLVGTGGCAGARRGGPKGSFKRPAAHESDEGSDSDSASGAKDGDAASRDCDSDDSEDGVSKRTRVASWEDLTADWEEEELNRFELLCKTLRANDRFAPAQVSTFFTAAGATLRVVADIQRAAARWRKENQHNTFSAADWPMEGLTWIHGERALRPRRVAALETTKEETQGVGLAAPSAATRPRPRPRHRAGAGAGGAFARLRRESEIEWVTPDAYCENHEDMCLHRLMELVRWGVVRTTVDPVLGLVVPTDLHVRLWAADGGLVELATLDKDIQARLVPNVNLRKDIVTANNDQGILLRKTVDGKSRVFVARNHVTGGPTGAEIPHVDGGLKVWVTPEQYCKTHKGVFLESLFELLRLKAVPSKVEPRLGLVLPAAYDMRTCVGVVNVEELGFFTQRSLWRSEPDRRFTWEYKHGLVTKTMHLVAASHAVTAEADMISVQELADGLEECGVTGFALSELRSICALWQTEDAYQIFEDDCVSNSTADRFVGLTEAEQASLKQRI